MRPSEQRKKREMTPLLARKKRKRMPLPSMEEKIPVLSRRVALSLPMLRRWKVLLLSPKLKRTWLLLFADGEVESIALSPEQEKDDASADAGAKSRKNVASSPE
jgi:hypothetical protein